MRSSDDLAKHIKNLVSPDTMSLVRGFISQELHDHVEAMIAEEDTHSMLRKQGMVRGIQEVVRLLESIYTERRKA